MRSSKLGLARIGLGFALATTTCQSGQPIRGTEDNDTSQLAAGNEQSSAPSCHGLHVNDAWVARGFCVTGIANHLERPRHIVVAPDGDLFVATRNGIVVLWDDDHDGKSAPRERATFGAADLENQGIAFSPDHAFLYYAGNNVVRRYAYHPGMRSAQGPGDTVITGLPTSETHPYKTLTFDRDGKLYVAIGSDSNLVPGPGAMIVRFAIPATLPPAGLPLASGEVMARGMRNAEALAWDRDGRLWAFSNGRDYLHPDGTPETFFLDHPGDWIYRVGPEPGAFYGYPFCWLLGGAAWGERRDPLSQWADRDPQITEPKDDAWCQNPTNVHPAAGSLPAHSAPLGAVAYTGSLFPAEYRNQIFVTEHGSWNRPGAQNGRTIVRVTVDGDRVTHVDPVFGERAHDGNLAEGHASIRPTGIAQAPDGSLYFTSDDSGEVFHIGWAQ